jgi:ribosomal protein L40E
MMVNCPECNADISSSADPCPKCGCPRAGARSKKASEDFLKKINKDPDAYLKELYKRGHYHYLICPKWPHDWIDPTHKLISESCSLEKDDTGYFVIIKLVCKGCGTKKTERFH